MEIAADMWDNVLSDEQRVALVDHELYHFRVDRNDDDDVVLSIRPHELEEFAAVLARHGLWRPDIQHFMTAIGSDLLNLWAQDVGDRELVAGPQGMLPE